MGQIIQRAWPAVFSAMVFGLALVSARALAGEVETGAYLIRAGGCVSCHTDRKNKGAELAGGLAFETSFGTFYSPNITPDDETGIGRWSAADFQRALRHGVAPDGSHYYPVFPYPSYSLMTDADAAAIYAYLMARPAIKRSNKPHNVPFPFSWRPLQVIWKWLFFKVGPYREQPKRDPAWNRGAYLVKALAHCGECHTPRNLLGAVEQDKWLAGTRLGPEGEIAPNITPDNATGIGDWTRADIVELLKSGLKPDYDDVQGSMEEAITDSLLHLIDADLDTIALYLKTVPAVNHKIEKK